MREVSINSSVEREKLGIGGNSMVRQCVILDGGTSEACDEFVDISYALNWAERITIPNRWSMNSQSPKKEDSVYPVK